MKAKLPYYLLGGDGPLNKKKYIIPIVIILFLIVISSFDTIISFVTDYQWFNKLGYRDTFLTKLNTQIRIGLIFTLLFVIIYSFSAYKESTILSWG